MLSQSPREVSVRLLPLGCAPHNVVGGGRPYGTAMRAPRRDLKGHAVPRRLQGGVTNTVAPDVAMFRSAYGMVLSDKVLRVCVSGDPRDCGRTAR